MIRRIIESFPLLLAGYYIFGALLALYKHEYLYARWDLDRTIPESPYLGLALGLFLLVMACSKYIPKKGSKIFRKYISLFLIALASFILGLTFCSWYFSIPFFITGEYGASKIPTLVVGLFFLYSGVKLFLLK